MRKLALMAGLFAATPFMNASTKEIDKSPLLINKVDLEIIEQNKGNCFLNVQYIDEDGATYQSKEYYWDTKSLEECFGKIAEKTKAYEANQAINILRFISQYN